MGCVRIIPVDTLVLWHPKLTGPEDGASFNVVLNLGQRVTSREGKTGTGFGVQKLLAASFRGCAGRNAADTRRKYGDLQLMKNRSR